MNSKIAFGILALTAMFAGSATAAEQLKDGSYSVTSPSGQKLTFEVEKKGEHQNGDGIYTIKETSFYKNHLFAFDGSNVGSRVVWSSTSATKWILHKSSNGWAIMHGENGANAASAKGSGKATTLSLQRNQGRKNQVWQIK